MATGISAGACHRKMAHHGLTGDSDPPARYEEVHEIQAWRRADARATGVRGRLKVNKRVLIIVQNLPVPLDRRVWLECQELVRAGYTVSVICPKGPQDPGYQELDGVRLYKYDAPTTQPGVRGYLTEFVVCWLKTARLSVRVRREIGFDVIQACNPPDTYALLAAPYKLAGAKFVYDQHDLCPEVYRSRFDRPSPLLLRGLYLLEGITYRFADHVISTNESYRLVAMGRGGRGCDDMTVVRSGPDTDRMRPGVDSPELRRGRRHLIVYLGVMGPQDGVDSVLHVLDILVHKDGREDIHLALLGFGDCLEDLRVLSTELGLDDYVTFTGRADAATIEKYLRTAAVGLGPDPANPLNEVSTMNKTMEYMAYGVPVVTFDLIETRVSAGDAACYVEPGDLEGFARAVTDLLDDPERRSTLGRKGRERAAEVLDWCLQAPGYVAVYDHLLGVARADAKAGTRPRAGRRPAAWTKVAASAVVSLLAGAGVVAVVSGRWDRR
ncbi:glycosyltransferase family 4 protein [Protofrankia symbiont of Coriaria ruscifolia]|uniref:glycosyltransferase family 4 protein n=1 Tax=Protofrankia symbiont of Coriaria ruscifolia TaxID=1306542 RepID=UPI001F5F00B9|nr:glycosyltransferase family 4 protein [Protofrankia symbiont of Coriaria ruscifolia]